MVRIRGVLSGVYAGVIFTSDEKDHQLRILLYQ